MEQIFFRVHGHIHLFQKELSQRQVLRLVAEHGCFGRYDANADGYGQTVFVHVIGAFQQLLQLCELGGKIGGAIDGCHKFVAAESGCELFVGEYGGKAAGKFDQNFVSYHMSVSIVNCLKIVGS